MNLVPIFQKSNNNNINKEIKSPQNKKAKKNQTQKTKKNPNNIQTKNKTSFFLPVFPQWCWVLRRCQHWILAFCSWLWPFQASSSFDWKAQHPCREMEAVNLKLKQTKTKSKTLHWHLHFSYDTIYNALMPTVTSFGNLCILPKITKLYDSFRRSHTVCLHCVFCHKTEVTAVDVQFFLTF